MHFAFDVDGVIADTHALVRLAYRRAGVEMPIEAWGRPWREWLIELCGDADKAHHIHSRKTRFYTGMLQEGLATPLPACNVVRRLVAMRHDVHLITSASPAAATALLLAVGLPLKILYGSGLTKVMKVDALCKLDKCGTYIDDMAVGADIADAAGWSFVRYEGQDERRLMEDLWMQ